MIKLIDKFLDSLKRKFILELKEAVLIADGVYDFLFSARGGSACLPVFSGGGKHKLKFKPGQYLGLILNGDQDEKDAIRYFSIASSPAEEYIRMGVKFYPQASSFKQSMLNLKPGDKIAVSRLAGNFVLPKNKDRKLVFIAGGIGITPFRSMIKHLLDTKEKRDIILFDSNFTPADIIYKDVFDEGETRLGIKTIYTVTNTPYPNDWRGERGFIDEQMIKRTVPDYKERTFYLSGSHNMAVAFDGILRKMGIPKKQIIKDFFPGLV